MYIYIYIYIYLYFYTLHAPARGLSKALAVGCVPPLLLTPLLSPVCMCVCGVCDGAGGRGRGSRRGFLCVWLHATCAIDYGLATVSRIDKMIGLLCRISYLL